MTDLNTLVSLMGQVDFLKEQLAAIRELQKRKQENEVIISVIGQFKRGKSSLINAMLGEEILPVGIIPLTTVVTEIRYGTEFRAVVSRTDGVETEISREEISDYCSEQKNKGNHKNVRTVKLWTPAQPFGEGIVLVDTPGVGSVHQHNTDSSYDYVKQSDAVIFLLSVDSPVSETERDFLLKAGEYAAKFFFAVNKADTVSEEDLLTFQGFCSQVISESMGAEITLHAVSAKTGMGISELRKGLTEELTRSHNRLLEESMSKKIEILTGQAKAKLALSIKAASLPAEELSGKRNRIMEKQKELSGFGEEVQVLAKYRTEMLVKEIQPFFDQEAVRIRKETEEKGKEIRKEAFSLSVKEFEKRLQSEMDDFLEEKLNALNAEGISMLETGYAGIVKVLNDKASDAACFIAALLKEEFGLDYPVNESTFHVSDRSDFFLKIGVRGPLQVNADALAHLLPGKLAKNYFYKQGITQAEEDVERNKNNMLYNYKYKMQESLRVLCSELSGSVTDMAEELNRLIAHIQENLNSTGEKCREEQERLQKIMEAME